MQKELTFHPVESLAEVLEIALVRDEGRPDVKAA